MLTIMSHTNSQRFWKFWYVGKDNPVSFHEVYDVMEVQADGDELLHIFHCNPILMPQYSSSVIRWFGDDAKFIVANLLNGSKQ